MKQEGVAEPKLIERNTLNQQGNCVIEDNYEDGRLASRTKSRYDYAARKKTIDKYDADGSENATVTIQYRGNIQNIDVTTASGITMQMALTFNENREVVSLESQTMWVEITGSRSYKYDSNGNPVYCLEITKEPSGTTATITEVEYLIL